MYNVKSNPVLSVPASTGIASNAAVASENGVSLWNDSVHLFALHHEDRVVPEVSPESRGREQGLIRALRVHSVHAAARVRRTICLEAVGIT